LFDASFKIGNRVKELREAIAAGKPEAIVSR
jgi:hypothetical protein